MTILIVSLFSFSVSDEDHMAIEARIVVGENIKIGNQNGDLHHVEPDLYVNPRNNKHWLASAMVINDPVNWKIHCAVWVSLDAGNTWARTDFQNTFADPQIVLDERNNAYFTALGQPVRPRKYYYYISPDGGVTWENEYEHSKGSHDHPFLTSYKNEIHWVSTTNGNTQLNFKKAINGGEFIDQNTTTFIIHKYRNDNHKHDNLKDGTLVVPYGEYFSNKSGPVTNAAYLLKSSNGGKTLFEPILISEDVGSGKGIGTLVTDKSESKYRDNLYYIHTLGQGMHEFRGIGINISRDLGETWSKKVLVQEPLPKGNKFYCPTAMVNKDGVLGVYWIDRRNDPRRQKNDIYFTASLDGGKNFLPAKRVTSVNSMPNLSTSELRVKKAFPAGGHYFGISTLLDGSFQILWSDARSGKYQLYMTNVKVKT